MDCLFLQSTHIWVPLCVVVRISDCHNSTECTRRCCYDDHVHPTLWWLYSIVMKHMSSAFELPRFGSWLCSYLLCDFGQVL